LFQDNEIATVENLIKKIKELLSYQKRVIGAIIVLFLLEFFDQSIKIIDFHFY
jgi:hypothetical protein